MPGAAPVPLYVATVVGGSAGAQSAAVRTARPGCCREALALPDHEIHLCRASRNPSIGIVDRGRLKRFQTLLDLCRLFAAPQRAQRFGLSSQETLDVRVVRSILSLHCRNQTTITGFQLFRFAPLVVKRAKRLQIDIGK